MARRPRHPFPPPPTIPPLPLRYLRTAAEAVYLREGPGRVYRAVCELPAATLFVADVAVEGIPYGGNATWYRERGGRGFVHASELEAIDQHPRELTVMGAPRIMLAQWTRVLEQAHAPIPAVEHAALYRSIVEAGIDPAIALACFGYESTYGTTLAPGLEQWSTVHPSGATWAESVLAWCAHARQLAIVEGCFLVRAFLQHYAPARDGHNPRHYAEVVADLVRVWRQADTLTA